MLKAENLVAIATSIAISLAQDKNIDELNELKTLVGQISSTLNSMYFQKLLEKNNINNKKM